MGTCRLGCTVLNSCFYFLFNYFLLKCCVSWHSVSEIVSYFNFHLRRSVIEFKFPEKRFIHVFVVISILARFWRSIQFKTVKKCVRPVMRFKQTSRTKKNEQ